MSRIVKRVISFPSTIKVNLTPEKISVEGPLGKSEDLFFPPQVKVVVEENKIITKPENSSMIVMAGTINSLIFNMIRGVKDSYKKILEVKGVGYKVSLKEKELEFNIGKSHPDYVTVPPDLNVKIERSKIIISGVDSQKVSNFAANSIKRLRMPSIYKKDKGIYYLGEKVKIRKRHSTN